MYIQSHMYSTYYYTSAADEFFAYFLCTSPYKDVYYQGNTICTLQCLNPLGICHIWCH